MKTIKSIIIFSVFLLVGNCSYAQANISNTKEVKDILLDFYTKYTNIWQSTPSTIPVNVLHEKLDSLAGKYCTLKLIAATKKQRKYGHDLLTYDHVSVELNENFKVEKDSTKANGYIVSFIATYSDAPGGAVKENSILHVIVVKEKNGYKIADVK